MKRFFKIFKKLEKNREAINWKQYLLDALMDNIPDVIYFKDTSSRFVKINKAMAKRFGIANPDLALGKTDYDFFKREHSELAFNDEQEIIRTGKPIINKEELETWFDRPPSWVSSTKMPLLNNEGKIIGTFGISREITENKKLQEEIEKKINSLTMPLSGADVVDFEELFDLNEFQRIQDEFSDATGVASITTKPDGSPITKPSNFTRFCIGVVRKTDKGCANCYKSDALLGSPNIGGPNVSPCLSGGLWDAGASIIVGGYHVANWMIGQVRNETQTDEAMIEYAIAIGADEKELLDAFHEVPSMSRERFNYVAKSLFTLANQLSKSAYQNLLQARFISEQKKVELALQQSEIRLQELIATKDKFSSIIAHDLINPFNSIIGFCDLMKEKIDENDLNCIEEYSSFIQKSSKQAMNLLLNLLEWSRIQTGSMVFTPKNIGFIELINEVLELMSYSAMQKSITITRDFSLESSIWADKAMLSTILRNLISNAIKFTNVGGSIIVSVKSRQDEVLISIRDNGVGIKSSDCGKLFSIDESFSTVGTNNERGTGLGLILCKEFVSKHEGKIWVESEIGIGSTFFFTIPLKSSK